MKVAKFNYYRCFIGAVLTFAIIITIVLLMTSCSTAVSQDMPLAMTFDDTAAKQKPTIDDKRLTKIEGTGAPAAKPVTPQAIQWVLTLRTYFATMCNEYVEEGPTVNQECLEKAMACANKVNLEAVNNLDALIECGKTKE